MTNDTITPVQHPAAPRRRHRVRWAILITLGTIAAFGVLGALLPSPAPATSPAGASSTHAGNMPGVTVPIPPGVAYAAPSVTQPARPAPVPTVTVTASPKPAVTVTATPKATHKARPAMPRDAILARFSGTGLGNTGSFTVPLSGMWHLSWAYKNGQLFAGQAENFQVYEYDVDSGALVDVLVNELAVGDYRPHAVPVYDSAEAGGRVYLRVITEDATWSLVPVSGQA